ncbi:hypothetical protein [Candidatus Parabeggiatoa sp. HSG14]|uniref:hypothetical protein n=1 Tax=Candidatus Parabeggiatoa sp. HSG14 TaxID=3055593 RepID=UPI0025A77D8D|nr:hypothetical protein [Thiotrichales bacterium HSG14]
MLTLPNYKIGSQIYESANSIVYRRHRKKDNQPVILKILKQDYPTQRNSLAIGKSMKSLTILI